MFVYGKRGSVVSDKTLEKTVQNVLESIAKKEGISVESVRREIDIAIAAARQNNDPTIQAFWNSIPAKTDESLTAEDVIAYYARMNMDEKE